MPYNKRKQKRQPSRSDVNYTRVPQFVAIAYAVVSALWILFSDQILAEATGDFADYQYYQTFKGWFFISASSLLIYFLLKSAWSRILAALETARKGEQRLQLAMASAGGGIWEVDLSGNQETIAYIADDLVGRLGLPPGHPITMAEIDNRRHPDDAERIDRHLRQTILSRGEQQYDIRYRLRCKDDLYRWVHSRGNVVMGSDGEVERIIGVALDIDDHVKAEERVTQLLRYDPATGLSKHEKFLDDIDAVLAEAPSERWIALVQFRLLDLNRLTGEGETVEDSNVARIIGDRLHGLQGLLTSRIATDVFALAAVSGTSPSAAQFLARKALREVLEPVALESGQARLQVQAGGIISGSKRETGIALLRNSGHALDLAEKGPDIKVKWFTEALDTEFRIRNQLVQGLENAVANNEIECHYQPLIDLETGVTAGFEALARWRRPNGELVQPDQFISLAEDIGKIAEIGEEVLRQACGCASSWPQPYPFVAVNVSPKQLDDADFPFKVAQILADTRLSPSRLELEITENAVLRDPERAIERIKALRDLGIQIAIDDFGTGYSSLTLLSRLPFTRLKIDRSFISGNGNPREDEIIVNSIIDLAKNLGLSITAEGVEALEQARLLADKSVDLAQGFAFSRPVPATEAFNLVTANWTFEDFQKHVTSG